MRLNKNVTLLAILLVFWSFFTNGSFAQGTSPTQTETRIPEGQHEYGVLEHEKSKNLKPIGTPAAYYKLSPMPDTPTNFKIVPGNRMAYLKWDQMPNALAYVLYISLDGKSFKKRFKKPIKKTEITLGVLENNKTYYFGIASVAHYGKLSQMAVQSVAPQKDKIISREAVKPQSCLLGRILCV
jgi:hypothetical protein